MFFGLFAPKPPLPPREKAWTEVRMRWLAQKFGSQWLLKARVILPEDSALPTHYDGTPEAARQLLDCLGRLMEVETSAIKLEVCEDTAMPGAAGLYQPGLIQVAESQLADAPAMVAVLAHELAHDLLVGRGLLEDDLDSEWVTDLLPVFMGLGVFTANATLRERAGSNGQYSWWSLHRRGYLNSCTIGYALALFAWARHERHPDWAKYLRLDAAQTLSSSLRFLYGTEDSVFTHESCNRADRSTPWYALIEQIERGSPSACVAGLWELAERQRDERDDWGQALALVQEKLHHRLPALRAEAARTLASFGGAAEPAVDGLIYLLSDPDDEVRVAAVYALGRLVLQPEAVIPHLEEALAYREMVRPTAVALAAYGRQAESVVPKLSQALLKSLDKMEYTDIDSLAFAVQATAADPQAEFQQVLDSCDEESRPPAEHILMNLHPVPTGKKAPGAWFGEWGRAG